MISKQSEAGFSLIEILVALAIMGFLSISLYTITNNNINTKDTVIKEDREFLQVYTAMYRFDKDFSQIYSPLYFSSLEISQSNSDQSSSNDLTYEELEEKAKYTFQVNEIFPLATVNNDPVPLVSQEQKQSLRFMTMANKRFFDSQKQSRYAWVEYFLETDDREGMENQQKLMRRSVNEDIYNKDTDFEEVKAYVLMRGITSFTMEFYSRDKEDWVENLKYITTNEKYTPRAIRITMKWKDSTKKERTITRVFRPYWPYFDVVADETARQAAKKSTSDTSNTNRQN